MRASIESDINDSIATKQLVLAQLVPDIEKAAAIILMALKNGNKILTCGNGGSAADAQHFSAELVARYDKERRSLPAIALTVDPSAVTAIGNDYSYDDVFARQIESLGAKGDVLIAITTSGNSPNVLKAIAAAQKKGMQAIGLTGKGGGKMNDAAIHNVIVPSSVTARVQESHILIIHSWCKLIDDAFVH